MSFHQADHNLLMIPGSIEVSDKVLLANASPSLSHTHQPFIGIFQSVLQNLRKLLKSTNPNDQAYVLSGSGTLGWDIVASNLIQPNENALLLSTGFFSDSFADCLTTYGAKVDKLVAPLGGVVSYDLIEKQLASKNYKIITITHVDTSTAVVSNLEEISKVVKKVSPETLIIVDGVCSVAVEDIQFDNWGLDFVLTASQKAIGVPPGLCILFASERAVNTALNRSTSSTFFASLKRWHPIMQNYENNKPSYFATPSCQLINALNTSLNEILSKDLDQRFAKHISSSIFLKSSLKDLGLELVSKEKVGANGLTAAYFPKGIDGSLFLSSIYKKGIVLAGGIHKDIVGKYFRIGHMGVSVVERDDVELVLSAIKETLSELGYSK
ncbi:alanine--glyoxylate transaminase [Ascoidea rubescens DSM 1968]|uniref:alanine--glyoxylate transaminase n=1 Tax=Ascoidea rubescens DSM 1968 TaxID=1344418 RepID=A0A1D2VR12_9ASCO|nr:PLP-dependent transferase [Ascoidea rubescens DSM 1968]ODV64029.1 PLP-dependent transferase [Ascoidea rubescens DSM 1968]